MAVTIFKLFSMRKLFGKWLREYEIIAQAGCQFKKRFEIIIFIKEFLIIFFAIHTYQ